MDVGIIKRFQILANDREIKKYLGYSFKEIQKPCQDLATNDEINQKTSNILKAHGITNEICFTIVIIIYHLHKKSSYKIKCIVKKTN